VQGVRLVAGCNWYIGSEPQNIVLVDPDVIRVFLRARITLESGARQRVERKALGAFLALLGARPVERPLAFAPVKAGEVTAVERQPSDAVAVSRHERLLICRLCLAELLLDP
jgi:hypothetical protein